MDRWKQYGSLGGLFAVCLAAGLWGFTATGGALPWAKRSAKTLQRGMQEGSGALVNLGRGVGVYLYVDRYATGSDGNERATR
uniref:Uncharacterized protein n=1 Tax=uncultured prokaryote 2E01B TaxID=363283 RepID=Q2LGQ9_9ZZZZ|nr:hypothetical protein [uncultured prokaryote 2E01B]